MDNDLILRGFEIDRWIDFQPRLQDAAVFEMDPAFAARLQPRNIKNRKTYYGKTAIYTQAMIERRFPLTSSAFGIDWDGHLTNGQHRAAACIAAGVSFLAVMVKGLDPAAFVYEDTHIKRSLSDMLCILKEPNYPVLAGALGLLYRYLNQVKAAEGDRRRTRIESIPAEHQYLPTIVRSAVGVQTHEALDLLDEHPGLRESVALYCSSYRTAMVPKSLQAVLHYLGSRIDRAATEDFLDALVNGVARDDTAPVVHLIRFLHNAAVSKTMILRPERRFAFCLKALRQTFLGKPMQRLALAGAMQKGPDGKVTRLAEEFPLLEDLLPPPIVAPRPAVNGKAAPAPSRLDIAVRAAKAAQDR